ncbi:MAG: winged helix-turn-helix transcriptional regulator, partial [Alphaproteobacteria bacterium]|nr:winged helix-turn-helix transcriptional regulator [Alphaproteobacteria bacterium]
MERIIEENKDIYYKALRRTQTTLKKDIPDWEPWIGFFLRCLKKQKDNLAYRLEQEKEVEESNNVLPELSLKILKLLEEHKRLMIAQIVEFTGANQNTLKVRLRELVNAGRIERYGKGRATWYSLY